MHHVIFDTTADDRMELAEEHADGSGTASDPAWRSLAVLALDDVEVSLTSQR
jgi:hypothetical protein